MFALCDLLIYPTDESLSARYSLVSSYFIQLESNILIISFALNFIQFKLSKKKFFALTNFKYQFKLSD